MIKMTKTTRKNNTWQKKLGSGLRMSSQSNELKKIIIRVYMSYTNAKTPLDKAKREEQLHKLLKQARKAHPEILEEISL